MKRFIFRKMLWFLVDCFPWMLDTPSRDAYLKQLRRNVK